MNILKSDDAKNAFLNLLMLNMYYNIFKEKNSNANFNGGWAVL